MRAKFINEIKLGSNKTGLGSIGVGRSALLFVHDIEKHMPIFDMFRTMDKKKESDFKRAVTKEIASLLFTDLDNLKNLASSLKSPILKDKLKQIMASNSTEEKQTIIPCEYTEEKHVKDENSDMYIITAVPSGRFFNAYVNIKYNVSYGVAIVKLDYNEPEDIERGADDDSLREELLYVVLS